MLLSEQGVAECQTCRNVIFTHKRQNFLWVMLTKPDTSSAPNTVCWSAIYRTDIAPFVKVFPMFTKKRQKNTVKLIKLKKSRKMIVCFILLYFCHITSHHFPILNYQIPVKGAILICYIIPQAENKVKRQADYFSSSLTISRKAFEPLLKIFRLFHTRLYCTSSLG